MELIILGSVFGAVWLISLITFVVLYKKKSSGTNVSGNVKDLVDAQKNQNEIVNNVIAQRLDSNNKQTQDSIDRLLMMQKQEFDSISKRVDDLTVKNEQRIEKLTTDVNNSLFTIRQENEKQLEKMRETVDEKLNNSLSQRLNDSFSKIQQSLESVNSGLGEMRNLATGVGDLKKVLTNVKTRGILGEISLENLLAQTLAPSQYESQFPIKESSKERVDFVVKLPGKDGNVVLLPIDSKFPLEDYNRLVEIDPIDKVAVEKCQSKLEQSLKKQAKSIKEKYIDVPTTTDFAIMFLPNEGLYSEVIKKEELFRNLQEDYKIIVCGPTTISALLNSLQLGFKTLAIEKRSSELWELISVFRQEFTKFMGLLDKTKTKLTEATNTIEQAQLTSGKIDKKLKTVSNDVGIAYDDEDEGEDDDKLPPADEE